MHAKASPVNDAKTPCPKRTVFLVLDNIRSMENVGAIFRSCDGAGVKKLILCGITPRPPRREISKTALGATESVDWEYYENTADAITQLKSQGIQTVALELTEQSVNYQNFDYNDPVAVVAGHETEGVSQEVLGLCDAAVFIPMRGKAQSLNVATSAGIILYHIT